MNIRIGLLCAALAASLAGCVHAPAAAPGPAHAPALLTVDTHVDIPLDYMRDPRYDVGGDSALQVDLGKMERGGLDAAFFVVYVGQGPLTADGYAKVVAQADRKYSAIQLMLDRYPDRIRPATTPAQVRANHAAGWMADRPEAACASESGAPGGIRTHDPCLRRAVLYPAELRAHMVWPLRQ